MEPLKDLTNRRTAQWLKLREKQHAVGFSWEMLPLEKFGNGPLLVDRWQEVFRRRSRPPSDFLSVHANCNSKTWVEADAKGNSFLLRPRSAAQGNRSSLGVDHSWFS